MCEFSSNSRSIAGRISQYFHSSRCAGNRHRQLSVSSRMPRGLGCHITQGLLISGDMTPEISLHVYDTRLLAICLLALSANECCKAMLEFGGVR